MDRYAQSNTIVLRANRMTFKLLYRVHTQNMYLKPRTQMFQPRLVSRWPLLIGACTQCHLKSLRRLQIRRIYTNTTRASEDSSCDRVMFK